MQEIADVLCARLRPLALYLCPQEFTQHLRSPDIHILAFVDGNSVFDLHYLPEVANVNVRIEVSAVGIRAIENEIRKGISTWLGFLTIAKLRMATPLVEDEKLLECRKLAMQEISLRPRFIASLVRATGQFYNAKPGSAIDRLLCSNALLIQALSLMVATKLGVPFFKTSDVIQKVRKDTEGYIPKMLTTDQTEQESALARLTSGKFLLDNLLNAVGADHSKLITCEW